MNDPAIPKAAVDIGAKALESAYKHRSALVPALKAGFKRLKEGKVTVAIFGPGGSGKTTTQTLLSDGLDEAGKQMIYYPTVDATKKALKDNWTIKVWDTPGQEDFRDAGWEDAFEGMKRSRRCLLINIATYGYNSTGGVPYSKIKADSSKTTKDEVIRNYLRLERKKEIQLLDELCERILAVPCKVHLLTIINKQDLWWTIRKSVYRHYFDGAYADAIKKISGRRPRKTFLHTIKEVSLCPVNLKTVDGVVLAEVCQGYDALTRDFYFSHLLDELTKIVGFEG